MGLFLAQTVGTNSFQFAKAQTHIISIARMDIGVGFANTTTTLQGVVCSQVTYVATLTGPTITRLDALVNNVGYASPPQIVALAVPAGTMFSGGLLDGVLVSAVAGAAFDVGDAGSPMSNHICTVYDADDCGGTGHWVDKQGGDTTSFPPDVILYHELAHLFHFATGVATSEPLAETDENDLRAARGLSLRNTASHNGGCGGGPSNCCIVASIATGSSFSDEIQRFRHFREHTLRKSTVGDDFFEEFHYRYYGFSPEVTRLMGNNISLRQLIRERFVIPLLAGVELLINYADNKGKGLAKFLRDQTDCERFGEIAKETALKELKNYLRIARNFDNKAISAATKEIYQEYLGLKKLLRHVNKRTLSDSYIDWSLVSVVELWTESALLIHSGKTDAEVDSEVLAMIADWVAYMPISAIWEDFSRLETELELRSLEQFVFDSRSKKIFSERLIARHSQYTETIRKWAIE